MKPWNDPNYGRRNEEDTSTDSFDDILRTVMARTDLVMCTVPEGMEEYDEEEDDDYDEEYYDPIPQYGNDFQMTEDEESYEDEEEVVYGSEPLTTKVKTILNDNVTIPDRDEPIPPSISTTTSDDEEDDGEEEEDEALYVSMKMSRYMVDFHYIGSLDILKIDDKISPTSYTVNSVATKAMEIVDIDELFDNIKDIEEKFGLSDFIDGLIEFIIMRKHPCAVWTKDEFISYFSRVQSVNQYENIFATYTDDSDSQTYTYMWYNTEVGNQNLLDFVVSVAMAIHNDPKFRKGMYGLSDNEFNNPDEESFATYAATICGLVTIADELMGANGSFNPNIMGYSRNYRAYVGRDSDYIANTVVNYMSDLSNRSFSANEICDNLCVYDYYKFFLRIANIIETLKGNGEEDVVEADDEEEEEDEYEAPVEFQSVQDGKVNINDFLDETEEMSDEELWNTASEQINRYADDETDYLEVANEMKASNAETTAAQAMYSEYVQEHAVEHPEEAPVSFDTFAENMQSTTKVVMTAEPEEEESDDEEEEEDEVIPVTAPPKTKPETPDSGLVNKPKVEEAPKSAPGTINADMFAKLTAAGLSPTATAEEKEQAFKVPLVRIQKKRPQQ